MIKPDEFIISFNAADSKLQLKNPHGIPSHPLFEVVKKLIDGAFQPTDTDKSKEGYQPINTVDTSNPPKQGTLDVQTKAPYTKEEIDNKYTEYCREHPTEKVVYEDFVKNLMAKPTESDKNILDSHDGALNVTQFLRKDLLEAKDIKSTQFYKDLLEAKGIYDRLDELMSPLTPSDSGFYRAVLWMVQRIDKEAEKPYSGDVEKA